MFTKQQLINIGAENLADIILSLYENRPDVQNQLEIIVAGFDSDPKNLVSSLRDAISTFGEPFDRKACFTVASEIGKMRDTITKSLLPKWPNQAVEVLLELLDNHTSIIEIVDDSYGVVGEAYREVCHEIVKAYKCSTIPLEDIVKVVYDQFMNNNDYAINDEIISDFKDALGDEGLKQLKQTFEQSSSLKQKDAGMIETGLKIITDLQLKNLAENNVDAYIEAFTFNRTLDVRDHLTIAKTLIKHHRGKEAIEWLGKIADSCWETDKIKLKIEALDLCGNSQEAQEERKKWFDSSLSHEVYNEILKYSEPCVIESWKTTAIQKAFEFQNPHVALDFLREIKEYEQAAKLVYTKIDDISSQFALDFLVKIKEFNQAAKLVYQKIDRLSGSDYYKLSPIADTLCKIDPLAATLLYRKMIEPPLEKMMTSPKSKSYSYAAKYLAECHSLSFKITDWQGFKNHQIYFKELSVQHKEKQKKRFWTAYKLALNKK